MKQKWEFKYMCTHLWQADFSFKKRIHSEKNISANSAGQVVLLHVEE